GRSAPDGGGLAPSGGGGASYEPRQVRLWDGRTGRLIARLDGPGGKVGRVIFSPDGSLLLTQAPFDTFVKVWDARTGKPLTDLRGHADYVIDAVFSPDGRLVA